MDRILMVPATGWEQEDLATRFRVVERYPESVLIEAPELAAEELLGTHPSSEDVTGLYTIQGNQDDIDTSLPRLTEEGEREHPAYRRVRRLTRGPHHYLVQFRGPIREEWLASVEAVGAEPREFHSGFTYVVRADGPTIRRVAALDHVRWVGHLRDRDRVAPTVGKLLDGTAGAIQREKSLPETYTVEFFSSKDVTDGTAMVKKAGFEILLEEPCARILVVRARPRRGGERAAVNKLARVHGVREIRPRTLGGLSNDVAARLMGVAAVMENPGRGLSGKGEYIGVCDTGLDTGDPRTIHPDFAGRVAFIKSYPISSEYDRLVNNPRADNGPADRSSGHGTHVAGSILGSGAESRKRELGLPNLRGLAPKAKLVFQAVEQELDWKDPKDLCKYGRFTNAGLPRCIEDLFADAYAARARIHANAWYSGLPGEYDEVSHGLDHFVWVHKDFCVVVAAGNFGADPNGNGEVDLETVSPPATAKNCISVGACESERPDFDSATYYRWFPREFPNPSWDIPMANDPARVVAFSGRGPTDPPSGSRNAPHVVAPGTFVLSTRSTMIHTLLKGWERLPQSNRYFYMGGTSQAAALTAGAVALLREHLRTKRGIEEPTAALLKAALIAGASRPGGNRPGSNVVDCEQGYGRVDLAAVVAPKRPMAVRFYDVNRGPRTGGGRRYRLDVRSSAHPLRVVLAYSDFPGPKLVNNLNLLVTDPTEGQYRGNHRIDHAGKQDWSNNVEVVHVPEPPEGSWLIDVVGTAVNAPPQDFALVCLGAFGPDRQG